MNNLKKLDTEIERLRKENEQLKEQLKKAENEIAYKRNQAEDDCLWGKDRCG